MWYRMLRGYSVRYGAATFGAVLWASTGHAEEGQEVQEDRIQRLERKRHA